MFESKINPIITTSSAPLSPFSYSPQKKSRVVFDRFDLSNSKKTAIQLKRKLSAGSEMSLNKEIKTQISSDSPIKLYGTPDNSPSKPALSVYTHSGTKLQKTLETQKFALYVENSKIRNEFFGEELKAILNTLLDGVDQIPFLPPIESDSIKVQTATLTHKKQKSAKKKPYRDQSNAITDNNGYVRANADITDIYFTEENLNRTALLLGFDAEKTERFKRQFSNFEAEWLHLIDYANIGEKGQCSKNLVLGSREANSQMIVLEEYINRILKKNLTAEIKVKAYICKLHISYKIKYTVFIPEMNSKIKIKFNPFSREKPQPELIQYLALVEKTLEKKHSVHNPLINNFSVKNPFTLFGPDSMMENKKIDDNMETENLCVPRKQSLFP